MRAINEDEAELLIEEHLRTQGWNLTDFTLTRKRWREHLDGEEADRVFLHEGKIVAILEAKKPRKDLWAALDQAKRYARTYKKNTGHDILLTKSKILYVQMKGRGTRKCQEIGKDIYKLVDFVDITRLEPAITNETPGIEDEPIEQEEEELISRERGEEVTGEAEKRGQKGSEQEMVIADVPVHLVFSETISPSGPGTAPPPGRSPAQDCRGTRKPQTAIRADDPLLALLQG